MAWRLDEAVIRGELDNRVRGVVTGRIWLMGREQPLELELTGNAWRDLAGRLLEFSNPAPRPCPIVGVIAGRQRGLLGDFTASRRIKVYRAGAALAMREKGGAAWSWSNGLYLEWFNTEQERVLIEAVSYRLAISPDAAWEMTVAEEQQQRERNAAALRNHQARLIAAEEEAGSAEWEQDRDDIGECQVEEPPGERPRDAAAPPRPRPERTPAATTMAEVGEALSSAAMLIRILDTEATRPAPQQCHNVVKRLGRVGRELDRLRRVVEFCRRERLGEKAWIEEVQREVKLHADECDRLLRGLRERLGERR